MAAPKKQGHYCKVCGQRKANEKFTGKGHAAHICKACAALPIEQRNEMTKLTRIEHLPFWLNKEQIVWLRKCFKDKSQAVRDAAQVQYELRFQHENET